MLLMCCPGVTTFVLPLPLPQLLLTTRRVAGNVALPSDGVVGVASRLQDMLRLPLRNGTHKSNLCQLTLHA